MRCPHSPFSHVLTLLSGLFNLLLMLESDKTKITSRDIYKKLGWTEDPENPLLALLCKHVHFGIIYKSDELLFRFEVSGEDQLPISWMPAFRILNIPPPIWLSSTCFDHRVIARIVEGLQSLLPQRWKTKVGRKSWKNKKGMNPINEKLFLLSNRR